MWDGSSHLSGHQKKCKLIERWIKEREREKKINKPDAEMSKGMIRSMVDYYNMKTSDLQDIKFSDKLSLFCYCFNILIRMELTIAWKWHKAQVGNLSCSHVLCHQVWERNSHRLVGLLGNHDFQSTQKSSEYRRFCW